MAENATVETVSRMGEDSVRNNAICRVLEMRRKCAGEAGL